MLELSVAWAERALGWNRRRATATTALAAWVVGLATVFSFNFWARWFPLAGLPGFEQATIFDLTDHLTSNLLLPAGGFALSILAGWILSERWLDRELGLGHRPGAFLRALLRYVVPTVIAVVTLAPYFV
jgi:NSS family neurotransmitter:Na+ symporter